MGSDLPARKPRLEAAQIKPYDLAIALTLMEGDKYRVLRPPDYLAFLRKHPGQNPIEDVCNTHNKIILWVKCSILHYEKIEKRSDVLRFFINAALVGQNLAPCRSVIYFAISRNVENYATFRPPPQYLSHYRVLRLLVCDLQFRPCPAPCERSLVLSIRSSILRQATMHIDWL